MTPVEYVAHELGRFEAELAALRVVERDSDPTPPHGIARPMLRRVDGGRSLSPVAVLCESRTAQILATARTEAHARYTLAAERTKGRGDRFAARILAGPPKGWQP